MLQGKTVLLGVTGSIAAYKIAYLASALHKLHADVHVLMTQNATNFINPITFETLTGNKCLVDTFDRNFQFQVEHVSIAKKADVVMIAPASANVIGKIANGLADDMLTTTIMACRCHKIISPAMNTAMYENPIVQDNLRKLQSFGYEVITPACGYLACGDVDTGRMSEPEDIVEAICEVLNPVPQDLTGKRIVITAGPTHEPIDPVRFIGNRSSGKMGIALAREAVRRGAEVTLVLGPTSLDVPRGVECVRVQTAAEMLQAALDAFQTADAAICAAAVADYTPVSPADHKLKKANERLDRIELVETVDILAELSLQKGERCVIGFAAETDNVVEYAERKLVRKGCDAIIANDVSRADSGFGTDTNKAWIVSATGTQELPVLTKPQLADSILNLLKNN